MAARAGRTLALLLAVGEADTANVRACRIVLARYEWHTLLHNVAYHRLAGLESDWIYLDDRDDRTGSLRPRAIAAWLQPLRHMPHVELLTYSQNLSATAMGASSRTQMHANRDCYRRAPAHIEWVLFIDGDEYIGSPGRTPLAGIPPDSTAPFSIGAWAAAIPARVQVVALLRFHFFNEQLDRNGSTRVPEPPVAHAGPRFFEPQFYTLVGKLPACPGKTMVRAHAGVDAGWFQVFEAGGTKPIPASLLLPLGKVRTLRGHCDPQSGMSETKVRKINPSYDGAFLYHYYTRSLSECAIKKDDSSHGIASISSYGEKTAVFHRATQKGAMGRCALARGEERLENRDLTHPGLVRAVNEEVQRVLDRSAAAVETIP